MDGRVREKWNRLYSDGPARTPEPARVLGENLHLLPRSGRALDLACGLGGNALLLARAGWQVSAWDISDVALAQLRVASAREGLVVECVCVDLAAEPFPGTAFDVIVVNRYLQRDLAPKIVAALNPGGLVFYQTFVRSKLAPAGPSNPAYLLADNELLQLFTPLRVRHYREDGLAGDLTKGDRDEAFLVAQKCCQTADRV